MYLYYVNIKNISMEDRTPVCLFPIAIQFIDAQVFSGFVL